MIRLYGRKAKANRFQSAERTALGGVALALVGVLLTWLLLTW